MLHKIISSKDISIEINGKKVALVDSYTTNATRDSYSIYEIGSQEPVASGYCSIQYSIILNKVNFIKTTDSNLADDIYALSDFTLSIFSPDKQVIFTNCNWLSVKEQVSLTSPSSQRLELSAMNRMEYNR